MAEESESKSISQVLDILKLFQRFGRSFTGLLLLELGWTLILTLAAKLAGEKAEAPKIQHVPFTVIWLIGSAVVFVGWGIYSRLFAYFIVPLIVALKPIVDVAFVLVAVLLGLLQLTLAPLVLPLHAWMVRRWIKHYKEAWIRKNISRDPATGTPSEDPEAAYARWLEKFEQDHGKKALEGVASDKIFLKKSFLRNFSQFLGEKLLTPVHSGVRIGLAPMESYVLNEHLVVPKRAIQQYGTAIANVKARLRNVKGIEHIRFVTLPSQFGISTREQAAFASRLFGLDTVLWGRYGDTDEQYACVYIYDHHPQRLPKKDDESGLGYPEILFPSVLGGSVVPEIPAISFSPQSAKQLHVVLLAAVLRTLESRHSRGPRRWLKSWDEIYYSSSDAINQILAYLVFEVFPLLPDQVVQGDIIPTADAVLVDLAGRWIGHQFLGTLISGENRWETTGKQRFARQLHSVLSKCSQLMPNRPEHFYRRGAVSCILGEKLCAIHDFQEAGRLDALSDNLRWNGPIVAAETALNALDRASGTEQDVAVALFAAQAACAINSGSEAKVRDIIEKPPADSTFFTDLEYVPDSKPVAIMVIEELLKKPNAHAQTSADSTS
jgi:hypothetical protein